MVVDGKVQVEGEDLLRLPTGQWVHFDVVAGLGSRATGTWDLTITLPNAPPRRFRELECRSKEWKRLDWLGFSSTASDKRVFYLDNMEIIPELSETQE